MHVLGHLKEGITSLEGKSGNCTGIYWRILLRGSSRLCENVQVFKYLSSNVQVCRSVSIVQI